MEIQEIRENIISLEEKISERMRNYIHYKSIRNFVFHFDEITSEKTQSRIIDLLSEYVQEIRTNNYDFDVYASTDLARRYLFNIAGYYRAELNFIRIIKIRYVFLYGISIDSLLYFSGILRRVWYIPVITSGFLLYYVFVAFFKEPRGRVYGMFY